MEVKRPAGRLDAIAALCAALTLGGCGYAITSTDGRVFPRADRAPDEALSSALTASASHDLGCPADQLEITRLDRQREYAARGCGTRALYRVDTPSVARGRVELVSRSADGVVAAAAR